MIKNNVQTSICTWWIDFENFMHILTCFGWIDRLETNVKKSPIKVFNFLNYK